MADEWILSVSQINEYVRRQLAADPMLRMVRIRGEISGLKRHYSGHWYFSLKDEEARIQCVMFRQNAQQVNFDPQDGMRVILTGSVSLFVRDGAYQFYCEQMREDGVGDLHQKFEELKQKLTEEGLFDASLKKQLPLLPRRIGIVTSESGAVLRDIVQVVRRRFPRMDILVRTAAVQGEGAGVQIAQAIEALNEEGSVDIILCGRGGGSMEDLWAFNEEVVARAIFASDIPVVSCVGHETDFTIADFVADMRAPTPSAAAEISVPVYQNLKNEIDRIAGQAKQLLNNKLEILKVKYERVSNAAALARPMLMLIDGPRKRLQRFEERAQAAVRARVQQERMRLLSVQHMLSGLDPKAVLNRGYAFVEKQGAVVENISQINPGDVLTLIMAGGQAGVQVKTKNIGPKMQGGTVGADKEENIKG